MASLQSRKPVVEPGRETAAATRSPSTPRSSAWGWSVKERTTIWAPCCRHRVLGGLILAVGPVLRIGKFATLVES